MNYQFLIIFIHYRKFLSRSHFSPYSFYISYINFLTTSSYIIVIIILMFFYCIYYYLLLFITNISIY